MKMREELHTGLPSWEHTVMIINLGQIALGKQCRPRSDCAYPDQTAPRGAF